MKNTTGIFNSGTGIPGVLAISALALTAGAGPLLAAGDGTKDSPFTGDAVVASMDAGAPAQAAYYLVNTDVSFGPSESVGVGLSRPNNNLTITGGVRMSGGNSASIGYSRPSVGNTVTISGIGSAWRSSAPLGVGDFGAGNALVILNGASGAFGSVTVGTEKGADGNYIQISGYGSSLGSSSMICVGQDGSGNSVEISDSASASGDTALIGASADSTGNGISVTGSGTVFELTGVNLPKGDKACLYVGRSGSRNVLDISDGASVLAHGAVCIGQEGSQNAVAVTGSGTELSTGGALVVGDAGSANLLIAQNGALVRVDGELLVNASGSATGNFIYLAGGFVAIRGDAVEAVRGMISEGKFKVWKLSADGNFSWSPAIPGDILVRFCPESGPAKYATSGSNFAGYDGLVGYTLISGGKYVTEQAGASAAQDSSSTTYTASSSDASTSSQTTIIYEGNTYYGSPYRGYYGPDGVYISADSCWFGYSWYWNVLPGVTIYNSWWPYGYSRHWPRHHPAPAWRAPARHPQPFSAPRANIPVPGGRTFSAPGGRSNDRDRGDDRGRGNPPGTRGRSAPQPSPDAAPGNGGPGDNDSGPSGNSGGGSGRSVPRPR